MAKYQLDINTSNTELSPVLSEAYDMLKDSAVVMASLSGPDKALLVALLSTGVKHLARQFGEGITAKYSDFQYHFFKYFGQDEKAEAHKNEQLLEDMSKVFNAYIQDDESNKAEFYAYLCYCYFSSGKDADLLHELGSLQNLSFGSIQILKNIQRIAQETDRINELQRKFEKEEGKGIYWQKDTQLLLQEGLIERRNDHSDCYLITDYGMRFSEHVFERKTLFNRYIIDYLNSPYEIRIYNKKQTYKHDYVSSLCEFLKNKLIKPVSVFVDESFHIKSDNDLSIGVINVDDDKYNNIILKQVSTEGVFENEYESSEDDITGILINLDEKKISPLPNIMTFDQNDSPQDIADFVRNQIDAINNRIKNKKLKIL